MGFEDSQLEVVEGSSVQVCISASGLLPEQTLEINIETLSGNIGRKNT